MHSASIQSWNSAWRDAWHRMLAGSKRNCVHQRSLFGRLRGNGSCVSFEGSHWCLDQCLEHALAASVRRAEPAAPHRISHRIPLGLLLLSRRELTPEQLRIGLEEQQRRGHGKIGAWLQALGYVSEEQLTAALARQWSCPVSRIHSFVHRSAPAPQIPLELLEKFLMVPVEYVAATRTLFVAFAEGVDHGVLYAIEQMMECRTQPCMAVPSFVQTVLQALAAQNRKSEFVFEHISDTEEFCRIVRSYCKRLGISEIRLARCGGYRWIRLLSRSHAPFDLLLRFSDDSRVDRSKGLRTTAT